MTAVGIKRLLLAAIHSGDLDRGSRLGTGGQAVEPGGDSKSLGAEGCGTALGDEAGEEGFEAEADTGEAVVQPGKEQPTETQSEEHTGDHADKRVSGIEFGPNGHAIDHQRSEEQHQFGVANPSDPGPEHGIEHPRERQGEIDGRAAFTAGQGMAGNVERTIALLMAEEPEELIERFGQRSESDCGHDRSGKDEGDIADEEQIGPAQPVGSKPVDAAIKGDDDPGAGRTGGGGTGSGWVLGDHVPANRGSAVRAIGNKPD